MYYVGGKGLQGMEGIPSDSDGSHKSHSSTEDFIPIVASLYDV